MAYEDGSAALRRSLQPSFIAERKFQAIKVCLEDYFSRILVKSVLDRGLNARGLTPQTLSPDDLEGLVEDSMVGLRLFVSPDRLPELMVELSEVLTREE